MPKHYPHGGSTISRTLKCRAWRKRSDAAPKLPEQANQPAERGSSMHDCSEKIVVRDAKPIDFLGKVFPEHGGYTITAEDVEQLTIADQYARELFKQYAINELEIEPLVELSHDIGGSIDVLGAGKHYVLVLDWKYGHVKVDAKEQLLFYGMCAEATPEVADMLEGKILILATIQPAVDDPVTVHPVSFNEFKEEKERLLSAIEEAKQPNPPAYAGTHCRYCKAAPYCETKQEEASTFLALDLTQSSQLGAAMDKIESIRLHIKAIEEHAYTALNNGEAVNGYKLVDKLSRRAWIDEKEAEKKLRNRKLRVADIKESKLKSPAQMEKTIKRLGRTVDIQNLVISKSSGTTIVPEDDKRQTVLGKNQTNVQLDKLINRPALSVKSTET